MEEILSSEEIIFSDDQEIFLGSDEVSSEEEIISSEVTDYVSEEADSNVVSDEYEVIDAYENNLINDPDLNLSDGIYENLPLLISEDDQLQDSSEGNYTVESDDVKEKIVVIEDPESKEHLEDIKNLLRDNLGSYQIPQSSDYTIDDIYDSISELVQKQGDQEKTIRIIGHNINTYGELQIGFLVAFFSAFIVFLFIGRLR